MIVRVNETSNTDGTNAAANDGERICVKLRWAANAGYAVLLVIMALIPSSSQLSQLSVPDWIAHATAYGIQAALIFWASSPSIGRRRALAMGFVGASVFGVVTEGLQLLHPGRSVELMDLVANTLGGMVVCGFIIGVDRIRAGIAR